MLDEALITFKRALGLAHSDRAEAMYMNNIASVYLDKGSFKQAEEWCRQSLSKDAKDPLTCHNAGLALLGRKKWEEGWKYYSASVGSRKRPIVKYKGEPLWDGTEGQTVVIYGEQGMGDEICFASMIPDVKATVILECDYRLEGLFKRSFDCEVHGTRNAKKIHWRDRKTDASLPIGELGQFYRHSDNDFPRTPYLKPCPIRTENWRRMFDRLGKPSIGIAWSGGTWENGSKYRYAPLEAWRPLFDAIDAHWVSLEYRRTEVQGSPVSVYPWATLTEDYDDTAALVAALDCVVSVPTSIWHLAGALGTPLIALKSRVGCWKTEAGLPFHPVECIIDWAGDWESTIRNAIPEVRRATDGRNYKSDYAANCG